MILLTAPAAQGDTVPAEEIRFLNLPWGSSPAEVEELLLREFPDAVFTYTRLEAQGFQDMADDATEVFYTYKILLPMTVCTVTGTLSYLGAGVQSLELRYLPRLHAEGTGYALSDTEGELWYVACKGAEVDDNTRWRAFQTMFGYTYLKEGRTHARAHCQIGCTLVEMIEHDLIFHSQYAYPAPALQLEALCRAEPSAGGN